jgi:hypothetical protein
VSERSINEILGWARAFGYEDRWEHPTTHVAYMTGDGYSVDDMLDWLKETNADVRPENADAIEMWWDPEDPDLYKVTVNGWYVLCRPTLHAALEAAVRSVVEGLG